MVDRFVIETIPCGGDKKESSDIPFKLPVVVISMFAHTYTSLRLYLLFISYG